jgi:diadenosine tetraphosphate (Ap4A) HIT family hydrolase
VECQTCRAVAGEISLTEGPRIDLDEHWMVEHCHPVAVVGWLVLVLKRHARALHELSDGEAAALGRWLPALARAMHRATECEVEYVVQFAEGVGFHHVHFHLMARTTAWPDAYRGPRVFDAFGTHTPVSAEDVAVFVTAVAAALGRA